MCLCDMFKKNNNRIVKSLDYSRPFVFINLKTYSESTNANALRLAKVCEEVSELKKINIIIIPQVLDIKEVASNVRIQVFSQHVDAYDPGKNTGWIIPKNLLDSNVQGSLINHSEHRLDLKDIKDRVLKLKELNMKSVVCVKDNVEAKKVSKIDPVKPDFIAVEPPELIGGEKSISSEKPEVIEKAVAACNGINVIVGAGVKDHNDLKIALEKGAKGVLLSSHFVMSKDPKKFLLDLIGEL